MPSDRNETVYIDVVEIRRETDAAFGVEIEDQVGLIWLPKSQVRNLKANDLKCGDHNCTLEIPRWLAADKGIG